ncbi:hypothetical protein R6Q59_020712 [Mikania micrantha]
MLQINKQTSFRASIFPNVLVQGSRLSVSDSRSTVSWSEKPHSDSRSPFARHKFTASLQLQAALNRHVASVTSGIRVYLPDRPPLYQISIARYR